MLLHFPEECKTYPVDAGQILTVTLQKYEKKQRF